MLMRRLLALVVLTAAACSSDPEVSEPLLLETPQPGHVTRDMRARVEMDISGDLDLSLTNDDAILHIVEIVGGDAPKQIHFFSISSRQPVRVGDGRVLLFTADLSPGLYEGPGTYELSDESGISVGGRGALGSAAYVQIIDAQDRAAIARYEEFGEPCTLVVGRAAATGSVDCPALGDGAGKSVALRWSWELL